MGALSYGHSHHAPEISGKFVPLVFEIYLWTDIQTGEVIIYMCLESCWLTRRLWDVNTDDRDTDNESDEEGEIDSDFQEIRRFCYSGFSPDV